jgi:hypothetical protein
MTGGVTAVLLNRRTAFLKIAGQPLLFPLPGGQRRLMAFPKMGNQLERFSRSKPCHGSHRFRPLIIIGGQP